MKFARVLLGNTWIFTTVGRIGRWIFPKLPRFMIYNGFNTWGKQRDLPPMPQHSFRDLYRHRRKTTARVVDDRAPSVSEVFQGHEVQNN